MNNITTKRFVIRKSLIGENAIITFTNKKDITFNLLSPNGEKIEQWIIKGAFLTAANFNDLDFASNDVVEIGLTMQYDYAILEF